MSFTDYCVALDLYTSSIDYYGAHDLYTFLRVAQFISN